MNKWFNDLQSQTCALVLGGGGARGCYEIGVWKALQSQHLLFDCVAGTSIGAIVGAIYVQQTLPPLLEFASTLAPGHIAENLFDFPESFGAALRERKEIGSYLNQYILSGKGMNISPLKTAFDKMFDYRKFRNSPINYACMTFNVTTKRPEAYFKKDITAMDASDIILASASCYPAFPMMEMHGQQFIDGGYWDNLPCSLAVKMGAKKMLAINVEGPGVMHPLPRKADVLEMKPILPLGNFLDFSKESAEKAVMSGYLETMKLMQLLPGYVYTFTLESRSVMDWMNGYFEFMFMADRVWLKKNFGTALLQSLVHFHASGLSLTLEQDLPYLNLLEGLAWLLQMDAWKIWSFSDFCSELLEKAAAVKLEKMPAFDKDGLAWLGSLNRADMVAVIHLLIVSQKGEPGTMLEMLLRTYPHEVLMAYGWYYLEKCWKMPSASAKQIQSGLADTEEKQK